MTPEEKKELEKQIEEKFEQVQQLIGTYPNVLPDELEELKEFNRKLLSLNRDIVRTIRTFKTSERTN